VLLSDYGSGLITPGLAETVRAALARRPRRRPIPTLIDSRYRLLEYQDLTMCTPNESEVEQAFGIRIGDDVEALEKAGRLLLKKTRMSGVLMRGSQGMALFNHAEKLIHSDFRSVRSPTSRARATPSTRRSASPPRAPRCRSRALRHAGGLVVMKRHGDGRARELSDAVTSDHTRPSRTGRRKATARAADDLN
jgi:hypothetical protein